MLSKEDLEQYPVEENLGNYYESIPAFNRKIMVAEELRNRKKLGIKVYTDESLEKLRTTKVPEKIEDQKNLLTGPVSYNLLEDPRYVDKFAHVEIQNRNTLSDRKLNNFLIQIL